jgi:hypothetical protein
LETEIEQIAKAIHKILELPTEKVRGRLLAWCKSEGITSIADWSEE